MSTDNQTVLVVDDDVDACRNLADILSDLGYQADVAHDGPAALTLIEQRPYHAAVLDYLMPGMDGLALCRAIRARRAGTVAIIVTAYAGGISPDQFVAAGASRVLPKPVEVRELLETLEQLISGPGLTPGSGGA